MATLQQKMTELASLATVKDNGIRVTITPDTVYNDAGGVLEIVSNNLVQQLRNPLITTPENTALAVNQNSYLYSPFYYVLDATNDEFDARAYHLDAPTIPRKFFYSDNAPVGVEVAADRVEIEVREDGTGYDLFVAVMNAADTLTAFDPADIFAQLSYIPPGTNVRRHLNGTLVSAIDPSTARPVDKNYIYQFVLGTNYDVNALNQLILSPQSTPMDLTTEFDLTFIVKNYLPPGATLSDIDAIVDVQSLAGYVPGDTYIGVTHEKITVKFGDYLEHLWCRSRTVPGGETFLRYASDVYAYYPKTLFANDPLTGNIAVTYVSGTGLVYVVEHMQGDPVLVGGGITLTTTNAVTAADVTVTFTAAVFTAGDVGKAFTLWGAGTSGLSHVGTITAVNSTTSIDISTPIVTTIPAGGTFAYGEHQLLHAEGELVLIDNVVQVVDGNRGLVRHVDMFLIDGKYSFATEDTTLAYRDELTRIIAEWITDDLDDISKRLLEQTRIYFYPRASVGQIKVRTTDGAITYIQAEQRLQVRYYVTSDRYTNVDLRESIAAATVEVLSETLKRRTLSRTLLEQKLLLMVGEDAKSVDIQGFSGGANTTFTVIDDSNQPSVGKRLMVQTNRTLKVIDAVDVEFVRHD